MDNCRLHRFCWYIVVNALAWEPAGALRYLKGQESSFWMTCGEA